MSSPATLNAYELSIYQQQQIDNAAVFGHGEYKITDQWSVLGGVRYTDSRNRANICNSDAGDGLTNELFSFIQDLLNGKLEPALGPGSCFSLNPVTHLAGPHFYDTLHQNNVSWQVGVNYQIDPRVLLYANVSRGYKAGSFPVVAASSTAQYQPVSQESVTSYEGGAKATLFDRRLQLNVAGFYYDYEDKQVRGKLFDPTFGLLDVLVNVPKSDIAGAEFSATARPIPGLTLNGGVTYLTSDVKSYTGYDVLGHIETFDGDDLPFTPEFTYTFDGEYRWDNQFRGGTPFVGFTVSGRSGEDAVFNGRNLNPIGDPLHPGSREAISQPYYIPGYATLDLRAGYEAADRKWKLMLFAKNVTNDYYIVNVIPGADTSARFTGQPLTYGVTLSFKM